MPKPYQDILKEVLIDGERLQARIAELGKEISQDYAETEGLLLVGILKGSVLFMTDLMRHITVPHMIDMMDVSSYGKGVRRSSGEVRILKDLSEGIEGLDVLIVEDIIDSGHTLSYVLRMLQARLPASLRICTLLDKHQRREVDIELAYVGFAIPDSFVFGYGLDIDEYYRNLPFIGVVKDGVVIDES